MLKSVDVLIVGAGLAGLVTAERLASKGRKILLIEEKNHIGGHCFDFLNENGIYVHKYGPHIIHTNSKKVWDYLSSFTEWNYYEHKVLGEIEGKYVPIPFNLNSMESLLPAEMSSSLEKKLIDRYGFGFRVPVLKLKNEKDKELQFLGNYIYEKVFLNYTLKQWGLKSPEELSQSVLERVPVTISRDNRYFQDKYQGVPLHGYSAIFNKMTDNPNIHLLLNTQAKDLVSIKDNAVYFNRSKFNGDLIYTGMVDELFGYEKGVLPYRSLDIKFHEYEIPYYQESAVVNYPNDHDFTRSTEFKYFQENHSNLNKGTVICREYPVEYKKGENNPFYVVSTKDNHQVHADYMAIAEKIEGLHVIGRLAEYKYYDMDQIVLSALETAESL